MKTRSALLLAFMIVVPAAAMFSHRIPAEVRRALRGRLARLSAAMMPGRTDPAAAAPAATGIPAEPGIASRQPIGPSPAASPAPLVTAEEEVAVRLTRLGAIGFECRPVAGGEGTHVATCSVPLDDSGQLLRVFSVSGGDARSATAILLDEVTAWRDRAGPQRTAAEPPRADPKPMRF